MCMCMCVCKSVYFVFVWWQICVWHHIHTYMNIPWYKPRREKSSSQSDCEGGQAKDTSESYKWVGTLPWAWQITWGNQCWKLRAAVTSQTQRQLFFAHPSQWCWAFDLLAMATQSKLLYMCIFSCICVYFQRQVCLQSLLWKQGRIFQIKVCVWCMRVCVRVHACMHACMRACMCAYIHAEITPHTKKVHGCVQNETNHIRQAP